MNDIELDILAAKIAERISVQPRWLKLKQAALYSSIGQKELIRLAENNKITGFKDNSLKTKPWIFDKESIDKYRAGQASILKNEEDAQVALELIESLDI